jgi:protein SCO1/2
VLRKYLQNFPGRFIALSGSPTHVEAMLREYHVTDQHVAEAGGNYSIDHTASIFLINSDGSLAGTIGPQDTPASGLAKLRRLISRKSV